MIAARIAAFVLLTAAIPGRGYSQPKPSPITGVWQALTYHFEGNDHPMEGILIFTDRHFAATVRFRVSGGKLPDLNATTGTYRTENDKIIFVREIAANIRTGDPETPIRYSPGERQEEVAVYGIESGVLTISFPSGSRYVARQFGAAEEEDERGLVGRRNE